MGETILALDLGSRTGVAFGAVGGQPSSYGLALRERRDPRARALSNLMQWLNVELFKARPTLIVKEAPMPLQAFANVGNSQAAVLMAYQLGGVVEAVADAHRVELRDGHYATVRKHVLGKGRMGQRDATKAAVIARCVLLGWLPRGCEDHDRADALFLWEWAQGAFFSRASALYLYGQEAPAA